MSELSKGNEISELPANDCDWNASAAEDGTLTRLTAPASGRERGRRGQGNPGPAAIAAVATPEGEVLEEIGETIGPATNNVAEYRALLLGIERAQALGASELDRRRLELIVRQVKGEYKVKDSTLRELHAQVRAALGGFDRWSIRHVRREHNAEADRLVNEALDGTLA